jgi:hypothetical protein
MFLGIGVATSNPSTVRLFRNRFVKKLGSMLPVFNAARMTYGLSVQRGGLNNNRRGLPRYTLDKLSGDRI